MKDKKIPGALTALEFGVMMKEFADAGEWMAAQLRSRSGEPTDTRDGDEECPGPKGD
ncbi:hypothetical protein N8H41_06025 [Pseudomonas vlassakiae]|uniref:hypothetical protein n=1 Tax=Pseudomonas vlassakiae TaxID=485888 RepID=UPI0021CABC3D|nr:hypothetical protein [Pseudomonas vlassakiae]MCU0123533.1 hypothetical protein [Pseudomonas vlassakiae]